MAVNSNIKFTSDVSSCLSECDIIYICVNTPPKKKPLNEKMLGTQTDMSALYVLIYLPASVTTL